MHVIAVGRPELPSYVMPDRFRLEVTYFMTPGDHPGAPVLAAHEYWVRPEDARRWLDELVVLVVSPLDAENQAEIELTEEQEGWLQWMVDHGVEHIRIEP